MAYNKKDFARIKKEYSEKYAKARLDADIRRQELHAKFPEIKAIDNILAKTGLEIMGIITNQTPKSAEEEIKKLRERNEELQRERAQALAFYGYPADYSDVKYECEKCGDTGYVETKMCECMRRALIYAGYESSGLGKLIHTQSFENFSFKYCDTPKDAERMKHNVAVLKKFAEGFKGKDEFNLLLFGRTGLGKTHLSTSVAKVIIERGFDVA